MVTHGFLGTPGLYTGLGAELLKLLMNAVVFLWSKLNLAHDQLYLFLNHLII